MVKRLNLLAILWLAGAGLAACADRQAPPPEPSLVVGFANETTASRLGAPVIEVTAANPQPLATAELIGPAGTVVAAAPGQLEPQMPSGYPGYGPTIGIFGGSWGSSSGGGIGIGVPLGGGYGSATVPAGALVRSRALILVSDMAAYRRDWDRSTVRLTFGATGGDTTTADIPAPAPGAR